MRLDRVLPIGVAVVAVAAIGFTTIHYATASDLSLEAARQEVVSIERGPISAFVTLVDGAHKPNILYEGESALEYSDWSSRVSSRTDTRTLWESRFRVNTWKEAHEITHSRSVASYEISQVTELEEDHVVVSYYLAPDGRAEIGPIRLTLAHYRWYFDDVIVQDGGAFLTASSEPSQIWFRHSGETEIQVQSDETGPHSFTTEYVLDSVPVGELTLVAREEIWFEPPH